MLAVRRDLHVAGSCIVLLCGSLLIAPVVSGGKRDAWFGLQLGPGHLGARVQVCEQAAVGAKLGTAAFTSEKVLNM